MDVNEYPRSLFPHSPSKSDVAAFSLSFVHLSGRHIQFGYEQESFKQTNVNDVFTPVKAPPPHRRSTYLCSPSLLDDAAGPPSEFHVDGHGNGDGSGNGGVDGNGGGDGDGGLHGDRDAYVGCLLDSDGSDFDTGDEDACELVLQEEDKLQEKQLNQLDNKLDWFYNPPSFNQQHEVVKDKNLDMSKMVQVGPGKFIPLLRRLKLEYTGAPAAQPDPPLDSREQHFCRSVATGQNEPVLFTSILYDS